MSYENVVFETRRERCYAMKRDLVLYILDHIRITTEHHTQYIIHHLLDTTRNEIFGCAIQNKNAETKDHTARKDFDQNIVFGLRKLPTTMSEINLLF